MIVFLNELENEMVIQNWNFKIPVLSKILGGIFMNSSCFPSVFHIHPYRSFYNDFATLYFRPGPTGILQVEENLRTELHSLDSKVSDLNKRKKNFFTFCVGNACMSSTFLEEIKVQ